MFPIFENRKKERSPSPLPTKLHVGNLTRNVNEEHLKEIFGNWGKLKRVELVWDRKTQQSKGFAYLEFETNEEAVEAMARMDGVSAASLPCYLYSTFYDDHQFCFRIVMLDNKYQET
jgi:RNA recognition motif-containing protein